MFKKPLTLLLVVFMLAVFSSSVFAQAQNRSSVRLTSGRVTVNGVVFRAPPVRNVPFDEDSRVSWGEGTVGSLVTPSGNIITLSETEGVVNELQFNGDEPVQVISGSATIVGSLPGAEPEELALLINGEFITVTVPVGAVADVGLMVDENGNVQLEVVSVTGGLTLEDETGNTVTIDAGEQITTAGQGTAGEGGLETVVIEDAPAELILELIQEIEQISEIIDVEIEIIQPSGVGGARLPQFNS